jgi:hypothetical protein
MPSSYEHFSDDQAAIEYALLWDDIRDLFSHRVEATGIRIPELTEYPDDHTPTRLVLQSEPEDGQMLLLWSRPVGQELVGEATLSVQNAETSVEAHMYELTPWSIVYYGRDGKRTELERDEIEEVRADIREAVWSPTDSLEAGETALFWEV